MKSESEEELSGGQRGTAEERRPCSIVTALKDDKRKALEHLNDVMD
jgi:hypothetical protein